MPSIKHKYIYLKDLTVDPEVQRAEGLDLRRVNKMAAAFDDMALGTVTVSARPNGTQIILDGWHRTSAAEQVGYKGQISANVFTGLSAEREHELFVLYNNTRNVSALTTFIQRVAFGDVVAVEINDVLTRYGWRVKPGTGEGNFVAVNAIESVYTDGARSVAKGAHLELVDKTVSTLTAAWGHDCRATHQSLVRGVGKFFGRYAELIDMKKLVSELQLSAPTIIRGKATTLQELQGGSLDASVAHILTNLHNHRKRSNQLPDWVWSR